MQKMLLFLRWKGWLVQWAFFPWMGKQKRLILFSDWRKSEAYCGFVVCLPKRECDRIFRYAILANTKTKKKKKTKKRTKTKILPLNPPKGMERESWGKEFFFSPVFPCLAREKPNGFGKGCFVEGKFGRFRREGKKESGPLRG